jgi:hypothetical protein
MIFTKRKEQQPLQEKSAEASFNAMGKEMVRLANF